MAIATTTRRAMLGAMSAAPVAAAILTTPAAAQSNIADAASWDRAFAAWQRAEAEYADYNAVFQPLHDACRAETDAVPHVTLEADPYSGKNEPVSTANWRDVADARHDTRGRYTIDPQYPSVVAHYDLMERLTAAADARDAEVERIRQRYGWKEANDHSEALAVASCDAESVLLGMPAPDAAALAWKLERMFGDAEPGGFFDASPAEWGHQLINDARRLVAGRA